MFIFTIVFKQKNVFFMCDEVKIIFQFICRFFKLFFSSNHVNSLPPQLNTLQYALFSIFLVFSLMLYLLVNSVNNAI